MIIGYIVNILNFAKPINKDHPIMFGYYWAGITQPELF